MDDFYYGLSIGLILALLCWLCYKKQRADYLYMRDQTLYMRKAIEKAREEIQTLIYKATKEGKTIETERLKEK